MRVLCCGLIVCDILIKPVSHRTLRVDTSTAESIKMSGGGDAHNVAVNLATLGVKTSLVGRIGTDEPGRWLLGGIRSSGVDASHLLLTDEATSTSAVLIRENGERNFVSCKGACHNLAEGDIPDSILHEHDILYVGSAFDLPGLDGEGMARLFGRADRAGMQIVLDVTANPCKRNMYTLAPSLRHVDFFMPSRREAAALSGRRNMKKAADFFHDRGPGTVAIKLGGEGSLLSHAGEKKIFPAHETAVVDTTGAGDAFVSGFIAAHVRGFSVDDCAKIGNAAGAVCIGHMGASGMLTGFEALAGMAGLDMIRHAANREGTQQPIDGK